MNTKEKLEIERKKLNKFLEKYGALDPKTIQQSQVVDTLLNKLHDETF